ncbi:MAG: YkvA family protein [Calditrichota bacterium]
MKNHIYDKSKKQAEDVLRDDEQADSVLNDAQKKADDHKERIKSVWADLQTLIQMLMAYRSGDYRKLPWKTLIAAMGAVLYFVNPLDIIPDFLGFFGFMDDAAVIAYVVNSLRDDLIAFRLFQDARPEPRDVVAEEVE